MLKLFGSPGCGSAVVEVILQIAGQPYEYVQASFWDVMEQNLSPAPYVLGANMTALDFYIAMVSRWRPGRDWFNAHCPKLAQAVALTEQHPVVAKVWEKNFGK